MTMQPAAGSRRTAGVQAGAKPATSALRMANAESRRTSNRVAAAHLRSSAPVSERGFRISRSYGSARGWLRLGPASAPTAEAMLLELAAAKAANRPVGLFENNGAVEQIYAW